MLHPFDHFAVERFLNRNVGHGRGRPCAMPVFFVRRKPDHVAGTNLFNRAALSLHPAESRCNDQRLAERMGVPGRAGPGFEGDARATRPGRVGRLEERIDPYFASEPIGRPFAPILVSRFV